MRVKKTVNFGEVVRRTAHCSACGKRFITLEQVAYELPPVRRWRRFVQKK
jgi:transcriptional regulator NrdR family protein